MNTPKLGTLKAVEVKKAIEEMETLPQIEVNVNENNLSGKNSESEGSKMQNNSEDIAEFERKMDEAFRIAREFENRVKAGQNFSEISQKKKNQPVNPLNVQQRNINYLEGLVGKNNLEKNTKRGQSGLKMDESEANSTNIIYSKLGLRNKKDLIITLIGISLGITGSVMGIIGMNQNNQNTHQIKKVDQNKIGGNENVEINNKVSLKDSILSIKNQGDLIELLERVGKVDVKKFEIEGAKGFHYKLLSLTESGWVKPNYFVNNGKTFIGAENALLLAVKLENPSDVMNFKILGKAADNAVVHFERDVIYLFIKGVEGKCVNFGFGVEGVYKGKNVFLRANDGVIGEKKCFKK